jgi:hypothetical protein
MANGAEADRGGPHKLLSCERCTTSSMAMLNKLGKSLNSVEVKRPAVYNKKELGLKIIAAKY